MLQEVRAAAIVISYHPDADVFENLQLLRQQLASIIVIDNGSNAEEVDGLISASTSIGFELIRNRENVGIAQALNQGVHRALALGSSYVFLFDQDSTVTPAYVETMIDCFRRVQSTKALAILVPRYVDRRFGSVLRPPAGGDGNLQAATTSGSLMPVTIFETAGFFAEELFIDGVDYEYSLRVRRLGHVINECVDAILLHSPGTPTHHPGLCGRPFQAANYSPIRRYYQERNKIWVAKRYWRSFPGFCGDQFVTSAKDLLKILLVEQDKLRKCRFFFRGAWDGLLGRTGKLRS